MEKNKQHRTAKQNYPGLVAFYDTRPGKEVGLVYSAQEPTINHAILHVNLSWYVAAVGRSKHSPQHSLTIQQ